MRVLFVELKHLNRLIIAACHDECRQIAPDSLQCSLKLITTIPLDWPTGRALVVLLLTATRQITLLDQLLTWDPLGHSLDGPQQIDPMRAG